MLLLAAWAISEAVHLITAIWVSLLVLGLLAAGVTGAIVWWRSRRGGW